MSKAGADATKQNRRIYLNLMPGSRPGTMLMRLTALPPDPAGAVAALISRGMLMGDTLDLEVVSNPALDPTLRGIDGKSAYQLARDAGYGGTVATWLASLVGGDGKSAYDIARELGYGGTKTQWLATLKGDKGDKGDIGPAGVNAFGAPASRSVTLATAYQASDKTKPAIITLNVTSTASLTLTGGQTHTAELLIGPTAASVTGSSPTGFAVARYGNSNTGALSIGLALSTVDAKPLIAHLPTGWFFALRVTAGTVSIVNALDQSVG